MMEDDLLELARGYVALGENPAFRHLLGYLTDETTQAEGKAAIASAAAPAREARNLIIAWQERKKIVLGINSMIEDQREFLKQREEEMEDERRAASERSSRANW